MKNCILHLRSQKFRGLQFILLLLAFLLPGILVFSGKRFFSENDELLELINRSAGVILVFLIGSAGFVGMIRGEIFQVVKITGKHAQVIGFIIWIVSWLLILYIIFYSLTNPNLP